MAKSVLIVDNKMSFRDTDNILDQIYDKQFARFFYEDFDIEQRINNPLQ